MASTPLGSSAQAAYAELLDTARHDELSRSIESLSGSFSRKTVKGSVYWYYQYTDLGGYTRQFFVGPDDDRVRQLVERARAKNGKPVAQLAKAAIALGCAAATPVHFRIIRRFNEIGFFRAGGVLVGAHAFLTYGNALGVSWGDIARTQDLDFAHAGNNIELALPQTLAIDTRAAIDALEEGFLPVPGFRPWDKTASFVAKGDKRLRLDFLTPMTGGKEGVVENQSLRVNLQPLRFLEFILEDIGQAVVLSAIGTTVVNVPDPARFAIHKLLVFAERRKRNPEKSTKDLRQAAALIRVLDRYRPDDLKNLWSDVHKRGPGWRKRASTALTALAKEEPDLPALAMMAAVIRKATASIPKTS
jgi:hypothetical protein